MCWLGKLGALSSGDLTNMQTWWSAVCTCRLTHTHTHVQMPGTYIWVCCARRISLYWYHGEIRAFYWGCCWRSEIGSRFAGLKLHWLFLGQSFIRSALAVWDRVGTSCATSLLCGAQLQDRELWVLKAFFLFIYSIHPPVVHHVLSAICLSVHLLSSHTSCVISLVCVIYWLVHLSIIHLAACQAFTEHPPPSLYKEGKVRWGQFWFCKYCQKLERHI